DAARGSAPHADRVVVVQHDRRDAAGGAIAGRRQSGQAAADDDDRIATIAVGNDAGTGLAAKLRRPPKRVARKLVAGAGMAWRGGGRGTLHPRTLSIGGMAVGPDDLLPHGLDLAAGAQGLLARGP